MKNNSSSKFKTQLVFFKKNGMTHMSRDLREVSIDDINMTLEPKSIYDLITEN